MSVGQLMGERAQAPAVTPGRILDLSWGIARTGALTAALDLDVFTHVADGARTAEEVADRCDADPKAVATLLTCLASLGLLEPAGDDPSGYDLAADSEAYLVKSSPRYLGDMRHMHHAINFRVWPHLADTVRRGAATDDLFGDDASEIWTKVTPYLDQLAGAAAAWVGRHLSESLPADAHVLDVGCGSGAYSRMILAASSDARVTVIDREEVVAAALSRAADAGLGDRVQGLGGDLRTVDWGRDIDLVVLSNVLHGYDEVSAIALLAKTRAALRPDGRVAIIEIVPDLKRPLDNPVAAFISLQMLMTSAGTAYSVEDLRAQLRAAGFGDPTVTRSPAGPNTLLVAQPA